MVSDPIVKERPVSKIASARNALREGGISELTRRTRLWMAGRIYPGDIPQPRQPRQPRRPAAPKPSASDVDHERAYAWFESRRSTYEELAAASAPYVDPDGVFFDVGGNIGYFTKVLAETVGFRGAVHLFEPVPNLAALCAITLKDVPYDVHIHQFGLAEQDATADIYIGADGNLGWNTMVAEKTQAGMSAMKIQIRAFADLEIASIPTFVKIDVEGAEHRVIEGMLASLRSWPTRPTILCEIGWGRNHPQWNDELAVFAELESLGYRTVDLGGSPVVLADLDKTTDVIFLPS